MKAFSVYQPFALAIVAGVKRYETRSRRTNIRGRVAVHAGTKGIDAALKGRTQEEADKIIEMQHESPFIDNVLCRGGILGTVEIVDCVPVEEITEPLTERERLLGDFTPGRFAWVLKDPVCFPMAIVERGKQGWWNWEAPGYQQGISDGFHDCGIMLGPHNENGNTLSFYQSTKGKYENAIHALNPTEYEKGYADGFDKRAEIYEMGAEK